MTPVSKGQKAVRVYTIRRLNLGHTKHEKVVTYEVNHMSENYFRNLYPHFAVYFTSDESSSCADSFLYSEVLL